VQCHRGDCQTNRAIYRLKLALPSLRMAGHLSVTRGTALIFESLQVTKGSSVASAVPSVRGKSRDRLKESL